MWHSPRVPRRPDRLLLIGGLLIAAQLGIRGWALSGSWFYFDDLAFMSRALNQPFDVDYLTESYAGHLMPGGFAVARLLTEWAPYEWWPWALVLLVMQAVASIGIFRLLLSMFGRRPFVLALLAGYLFWIFTIPAGIWFAAGINQLPLQIALAFGLTSHLAYLRTRRIQHLVATLLWTGFGLLFYEKTLLLFGLYAIIALCWFGTGATPARLRSLWDRYRTGILVQGGVVAAYGAAYVTWGLNFSPGEANNVPWAPVAWNLVGIALAPGLIGGPLSWQPLDVGSFANPSDLVMLASWAALGGAIFYAFYTRNRSRRAWAPLAFTLVANVVLLASARANIVGPEIGREYRYQTESAAIAAICLGLAFLPLLGAVEVNEPRDGVARTYDGRLFVGAITGLVVVLALVSTVRYVDLWQDNNPSRAYFDNVQSSLDRAEQPVPLANAGVPQTLLWSFRYPENTYEQLFRPWSDQTSFPRNSLDDLYVFDGTGRLAEAVLEPARQMKAPARTTKGCDGWAMLGGPVTIPLDGPVIGAGWWIAMDYSSPDDTSARVVAGTEVHEVDLPAGDHRLWLQAAGTFRTVQINSYPDDPDWCVEDLALGSVAPGDPASASS